MTRHLYFVLSLIIVFFGLRSTGRPQSSERDAQLILQRMTATYANARSYRDSGVVRLVPDDPLIANNIVPIIEDATLQLQSGRLQSGTVVSFKTYYLRPSKFRFQWRNSSAPGVREAVIWSNGRRAYSWMASEASSGSFELTSSLNLGLHLEDALSSSLGSIFFVPSLLMKDVSAFSFADMLSMAKQASIVREDLVDGERCYVIKTNLSGIPWLLWVDKKSYLLRKTRTLYSSRSFHDPLKRGQSVIAEEIHTNIRINRRVPRKLFTYRPVLGPRDLDLTKGKSKSP